MIEAIAYGTPAVALYGGRAVSEVVGGVTGPLCDRPDDPEAANRPDAHHRPGGMPAACTDELRCGAIQFGLRADRSEGGPNGCR
jgi:hypothetical protein